MNRPSFKNNVIIITGATSGIGKELALRLAGQGAKLSLAARDSNRLKKIVSECRKAGGEAIAVETDVSIKNECKNLIDKTVAKYKRIDTLINNAGITMWAMFDEINNISLIERIMKVNFFGSMYCTHFALPYLKERKGRLVGVSSLIGKTGVPTRSGYAASKHAMAGFFDSLRIELADVGVSVTMIYPGLVATEVRERALGKDGKPLGKSHIEESKSMSVEECVNQIIPVIEKRERELVMTAKGKVGLWLKLIAPGLVDKIAKSTITKGK